MQYVYAYVGFYWQRTVHCVKSVQMVVIFSKFCRLPSISICHAFFHAFCTNLIPRIHVQSFSKHLFSIQGGPYSLLLTQYSSKNCKLYHFHYPFNLFLNLLMTHTFFWIPVIYVKRQHNRGLKGRVFLNFRHFISPVA